MKYLGILLLSLTCLASPVSAGCAWILWQFKQEGIVIGAGQWRYVGQWYEPMGSFETISECKNKAKMFSDPNDITGKALPNGNLLFIDYICMPDTVDPRSPKG